MREAIEEQTSDAELERTLLHAIGTVVRLHEMTEAADRPRQALAGHPERIRVWARDGRVTLTGTVRSWAEGQAVVGAVRRAPGVLAIDNRLRINPNV